MKHIKLFEEIEDFDLDFDDISEDDNNEVLPILQNLYDYISSIHSGPKTKLRRFLRIADFMVANKELTEYDLNNFLEKIGKIRQEPDKRKHYQHISLGVDDDDDERKINLPYVNTGKKANPMRKAFLPVQPFTAPIRKKRNANDDRDDNLDTYKMI